MKLCLRSEEKLKWYALNNVMINSVVGQQLQFKSLLVYYITVFYHVSVHTAVDVDV
jgi:hypothetical protein